MPLNLVPKSGNPGKFCLIHNLAFPYNSNSDNANIPNEQATVVYDISLGIGCHLGKQDFDAAFRLFDICKTDLQLLGFTLDGDYFINSSMTFGAISSCNIFEIFVTAVHWILVRNTGIFTICH